ncbi:MAG: flagellar hook-basal body complex protein [Betaproteobacteria bacterium]|nr:flagellar hook-basal body complex protein [Betaproteobacteria bacterium]
MSFYTSLTGLNSATAQLAVTANNIANVGTSGFKRSRADFGDIFSTSPLQKASAAIGQGVLLKQVSQEFSQGNISTSGNSLDLAITGDGFFPLRSPDGLQEIYTRNGSFTLNDQNNVVNSTGQRLLAASVDSSGKADLTNLAPLTIPPKTSGQAQETKSIQLGLNLPASSSVIDADFDRTNPATYNKSTALTVYDSGGNGYLATVYYKKTQNASQSSPFSKWQTYFYVGNTLVKPGLQQKTDATGSALYVNKYGDVLPKSDSQVVPSSGKTEMYTFDELTDTRFSTPAKGLGAKLASGVITNGVLQNASAGTTLAFSLKVDGATTAQDIIYTMVAGDSDPQQLATNLEVAINNQMGTLPDGSARYGLTVSFDPDNAQFSISSGTTGDGSSMEIIPDTTRQVKAVSFTGTFSASNVVSVALGGTTYSHTVATGATTFQDVAAGLADAINAGTAGYHAYAAGGKLYVKGLLDGTAVTPVLTVPGTATATASTVNTATAETNATSFLGFQSGTASLVEEASLNDAVRGKSSAPAKMLSDVITINTSRPVSVTSGNKDFFVTVDGIAKKISLDFPQTLTMDKLAEQIEGEINAMVDADTGRKVCGVTVAFNATTKKLEFTTGTTGDNASIQVSGSGDWGLANTTMQFGKTTSWIKLQHHAENGALQYVKNGVQSEDGTGLSTKTEWWPVYLDRGELSFDLTGKPVSPLQAMPFETAFLDGGKGALTMSIDFTQSTQYSSAFAVLSQAQDGAPEGDLMGLNIGVDGLVNATYSNGSQISLGKIVLTNFSSPSGLRQAGDASYLASATSGAPKLGEAGSAGFGSLRAGATERANVDLTQELVDLINAQRNFQANAKAIETNSTMTQAVINLRS